MSKPMHKTAAMLVTVLAFFQLNATPPNAPYNLRSFDKVDPIGTDDKPYFAWFVDDPDDNEIQSAYQVIVASNLDDLNAGKGDVWDSGKTLSGMQNYVYAQASRLLPASVYYWKVRTWDKDGNVGPYSPAASFATGLLANNHWEGAKWIKRNTKDADDYTYFRKNFALPNKTIKRAVAYVAACHSYELYVNGTFIGKGFGHHYPQYAYYNAWDISGALSANAGNAFACLTHWYGGGQGRAAGARGWLMKAVIQYTDGTSTVIGTDGSWKQTQASQWAANQQQRNGEGVGRIELYDSRKTLPGWNMLDFDDSVWGYATEIGPHPVAPWTGTLRPDLTCLVEQEIKPVSITPLANGKYVIDLGKIYPGSFKIAFNGGNAGDTIKMVGGFVLNADGTVSTKLDQDTRMDFYFVLNGQRSVFNPYVYLGMRYLQVDRSPNVLDTGNVRFVCRHQELDPSRSSFSSSSPMLNNVWALMAHSLVAGAQEGFVDTPTREKGTFLLDSWAQSAPAMSTMYDRTMTRRSLNEFLDSQEQYWPDGRLNAVYPNVDGGRDIPDFTQAYLVWVWDYYMQTGNIEFLKTNYPKLQKIAAYVDAHRNKKTGLVHQLAGGKGPYQYGIIDWPAAMRYGYDMDADARTVINAYAYADFDIISKIAEAIGNDADSRLYAQKAASIKKAINARLVNKNGLYTDGLYANKTKSSHVSQQANMMPLALGIVPAKSIDDVVDDIKKRHMSVGMVTLRWLLQALGQADEGPHLIDLYTNTEWEGWAKTITLGATVTWESWNASVTNESMSHPWGAVGLLAMQNYILGIQPLMPQHRLVQIRPLFFGDKLTQARGTYPTDKGDVSVAWENSGTSYTLQVTLPPNMTAQVYLPMLGAKGTSVTVDGVETKGEENGRYIRLNNIGSGKHTFVRNSSNSFSADR